MTADCGIGQDRHGVRLHFQQAASDEDEFFRVFACDLDAHSTRLDARDQRRVLRVDTQLARFTGQRDDITIRAVGNTIRDAQGMTLVIAIHDVRPGDHVLGALDANVVWTADGIKRTLQAAIPLGGVLFRSSRLSWAVLMTVATTAFALIVVPLPKYWLYVGNDVVRWLVIAMMAIFGTVTSLALLHRRQVRAARDVNPRQ